MTRDPDHSSGQQSHGSPGHASPQAFPLDPARHRALAAARRATGDELGAVAHLIAAQTLDAYASGAADAHASNLCDVATGYFMKGDHEIAAAWYELVLTLDPTVATACQNLAAIHAGAGRLAEADAWRERAYRLQRVFVEQAPGQTRRVLILCAGGAAGNVPFDALLPGAVNCRIKYAIDYADDTEDAQLPPFDLVFNAIGEPDVAGPLAARLERFATRLKSHPAACDARVLLNAPAAVARTARHRIPALLGDLRDVQVARCIRVDAAPASPEALTALLADGGIALPVLARPAATHGGEGLARCDDPNALLARLHESTGPHYLSAYRDTRAADGYYRKYRMIFVDREPFPYHLAISPHWMVHYFSAEMEGHAWKLDEERRFLEDPAAALGERALQALAAIGQRLELDYAGIDFTLLPDRQVFVFEANATMLAHYERSTGPLAHKNPFVQHIVDAFERLMKRRTAAE
ncbi:MAG: hypothetical protein AB1704_35300 [Pseudomonadota bacterium]|uniref:ATP-grasp domain-containing protein n=1 Tax=Burkholderiaceae TaxID=119060 RepID=UPI0010F863B8|nr:hypothetical protein [Burkholderia sp. 4M9327F10]